MKKKNDPFFVKGKKQRDARKARLEKRTSYETKVHFLMVDEK